MAKKTAEKEIVRLFRTDLPGDQKAVAALTKLKGVSFSFADACLKVAKIDKSAKLGQLSEKQLDELKKILKDPSKSLPRWILNRSWDPVSGERTHLVGSDLEVQHKRDLDRIKKSGTYKGIRHKLGLPVRGQRTQSSFRSKPEVGVKKKIEKAREKKKE